MSEARTTAKPEVTIDRLVLALPGMDAAAARELAKGVAEGLAGAGFTGEHHLAGLTLEAKAGETPARLAARIVQSLLSRIG